MASFTTIMVPFTKEIGSMINNMEMVLKPILMEPTTQASTKTDKSTAMASLLGAMAITMKEISLKTEWKEMESTVGQMVACTMGSG